MATTKRLLQLVAMEGLFPSDGGAASAYNFMGMIHSFAGSQDAYGAPRAGGQSLLIHGNTALYALMGGFFGATTTTFNLPNLDNRIAIGGTPGARTSSTLKLTHMIAMRGYKGSAPTPGMVALYASSESHMPSSWLPCDGRLLSIAENRELFDVIAATYGGDGKTNFALPRLEDTAIIGSGPGFALGQRVNDAVPGLVMNYLICTSGEMPPSHGRGIFPEIGGFLGQVVAFAGAVAPKGWTLCDGRLLSVSANSNLYSLLGRTFGGDGGNNFALPDLRGAMVMGYG